MRFLTRLLKTPDADQEEGQDEFHAEENGLLMVPSLPGEGEGTAPVETRAARPLQAEAPVPEGGLASQSGQGEAESAQDDVARPPEGEGEGHLTDKSPPAETQPEQPVAEDAQAEQGSSDDPLALFRVTATKQGGLPSALREGLEDVPAADLLAEARSIRSSLLGGQAAGGGERRRREAA